MITKVLTAAALLVVMVVSSLTTYSYLSSQRTNLRQPPKTPLSQPGRKPSAPMLPGTIYLVQQGAIYSFSDRQFQQLTPSAGWIQPAVLPGSSDLLAVKREFAFSDVYRLDLAGHVLGRLTNNAAPSWNQASTGAYHWSFYPRPAPDGKTFFMSYDSSKEGDYQVDLAISEMPIEGGLSRRKLWTFSNNYSGGDVQPVPLANGGLIFVKYDLDSDGRMASQIWLSDRRLTTGKPLTGSSDNCSQPALSPDGGTLAMICSYKRQVAQLMLASFDGNTLGPSRALVSDRLVAQPTWAPDGSGLAYLAPARLGQPFQLWWLDGSAFDTRPAALPNASPSSRGPVPSPSPPVKPVAITSELGFDATSPLAWRP